jgi:enterochelin esterase family protein
MPRVESTYNISKDRNDHAIAGLSMGGLEAVTIGLAHTDRFGSVIGLSAAVQKLDFSKQFASLDPETANHTWLVWRDNLIHFAPLLFQ